MAGFNDHLTKTWPTLMEVAVIGGGEILTQNFLNRDKFFAGQIVANPRFVDTVWYQHWGGIQAAGFAFVSTYMENPWLKLLLIGAAISGGIQEFRQLTADPGPVYKYPPIGNRAQELEEANKKLKELAQTTHKKAGTYNIVRTGGSITNTYGTAVAGSITNTYGTAVAGKMGYTPVRDGGVQGF